MTREQVYTFMRNGYKLLTRITKINEEFLPTEGPFILTTNHMSRFDFPAFVVLDRCWDVYCVAADSYKTFPVFGKMLEAAGTIWIDRSKMDFTAMKKAIQVLKDGKILALSPEGTRSRNAQLLEGKEGVTLIASKSRVPICTVSLTGTENAAEELKHFRRPQITMRFSPPFMLPEIDRENREASTRAATDEIMCRIAAMLPTSYRGFYKDHPRVAELTEEWKKIPGLSLPEN